MSFSLSIPEAPVGRDWTGLAGKYKAFALEQARRSAEIGPNPWYADATPCVDGGGWVTDVPAGTTVLTTLVWTAEYVKGVPALPDTLGFLITVGYDPTCSPPPGRRCGPVGSVGRTVDGWSWTFTTSTVPGVIRIAGEKPTVVGPGQAIDAVLSDRRFLAWLDEEPPRTWSVANVVLVDQRPAQGIVPAGPSWEVNLFREKGVPRNWAIGFVDPTTGKLRNLAFCNAPCSR